MMSLNSASPYFPGHSFSLSDCDSFTRLVFRWLVIPYVQKELEINKEINNHAACQHDHHQILPKGIPDLIFNKPHNYNQLLDFKVMNYPLPSHLVMTHITEQCLDTHC